jgi:hypothetical protein
MASSIAVCVHRVVLVGCLLGITQLGHAESTEFVGLFEGHGIAPTKDPVKRWRAIVAAQRLSLQCKRFYQVNGGGTATESIACSDGELDLKRLGAESAPAILDVLDSPRVQGEAGAPLSALLRALGNTGRAVVRKRPDHGHLVVAAMSLLVWMTPATQSRESRRCEGSMTSMPCNP